MYSYPTASNFLFKMRHFEKYFEYLTCLFNHAPFLKNILISLIVGSQVTPLIWQPHACSAESGRKAPREKVLTLQVMYPWLLSYLREGATQRWL